jgi:hypothetical protein
MKGLTVFFVACALTLYVYSARADDVRKVASPTVGISRDGRALEIKRASDAEAVRVPVLDRCGDPIPGPPKIWDVRLEKGNVVASYGKHCWATVSLKTLAIGCTGCD